MIENLTIGEVPATRQKYVPAFRATFVRQAAASAGQVDEARTQGISPALLGH